MLGDVLTRAWKDTKAALGGLPAALSMLAAPTIGMAIHFWLDGATAMSAEAYVWAMYVLSPLGMLFVVIFLWNLAAAPYRIVGDRLQKLSAIMGLNEHAIDALFEHSEYTMDELSNLLSRDSATKNRVREDLTKGLLDGEIRPLFKDRFQERAFQAARENRDKRQVLYSTASLLIPRDQARDYLFRAGYLLPQWLQGKQAKKLQ